MIAPCPQNDKESPLKGLSYTLAKATSVDRPWTKGATEKNYMKTLELRQ